MQGLAEAIADVIAGAAAFCDSTGNTSICFSAESNISTLVEVRCWSLVMTEVEPLPPPLL